jgi:hypothetical protein
VRPTAKAFGQQTLASWLGCPVEPEFHEVMKFHEHLTDFFFMYMKESFMKFHEIFHEIFREMKHFFTSQNDFRQGELT